MLIRLTQVEDNIDIILNIAHIQYIVITEDGWSGVQTTRGYYTVKQSFNEIIKLSRGEA